MIGINHLHTSSFVACLTLFHKPPNLGGQPGRQHRDLIAIQVPPLVFQRFVDRPHDVFQIMSRLTLTHTSHVVHRIVVVVSAVVVLINSFATYHLRIGDLVENRIMVRQIWGFLHSISSAIIAIDVTRKRLK